LHNQEMLEYSPDCLKMWTIYHYFKKFEFWELYNISTFYMPH